MDLSQAEAVMDLINSKSMKEKSASLNQLEGVLGRKIAEIKGNLVDLLVDIEANIDYPEYDVEEVRREKIDKVLAENIENLERLEKSFEDGKVLKNGVNTAIVGKPNVGKSSLLNVLLKEERAIVTEIAGTTRDTIEEYLTIRGIPLKIEIAIICFLLLITFDSLTDSEKKLYRFGHITDSITKECNDFKKHVLSQTTFIRKKMGFYSLY